MSPSTGEGVGMALRVRHRALGTPWWIVVAVLALGTLVTGLLLQVTMVDQARDQATIGNRTASAVAQDITRTLSRFYTPTVAAQGLVAGVLDEAADTGVTSAEAFETTWPVFSKPLADDLGDALLDFQLAPEAIVTYSARPAENAAALGHNLLVDDDRRDQIIEAIEARSPIVAGPLDLLQGGRGLIIRQAVFLPGLAPFAERFTAATGDSASYPWMDQIPDDFWGMTTTVIDFDRLTAGLKGDGTDDTTLGIFPVEADGSVGEPIWGTLPADAPYTAEQEVALVDGDRWLVRVDIASSTWWDYWPLLLVAAFTTAIVFGLARYAYRAQRRSTLGFAFSESISHLTMREEVLQRTSGFLTELYPGIRGSITSPEPHPCEVGIPVGAPGQQEDAAGQSELQWRILQSGTLQCVIDVNAGGPFDPRELNEIIGLIRRILGASLAALGREGQLAQQAAVDHLTNAYNRSQLIPVFERVQEEARLSDDWVTVACLDIDDFKSVNDTMGHLFGDEVLKSLTETLQHSLRARDAVIRFGGDEFVVLAALPDASHAGELCQRLQEQATHALTVLAEGRRSISVSLGFVTVPGRDPATVEGLLQQADAALYEAKASGGDHVREGLPASGDSIR